MFRFYKTKHFKDEHKVVGLVKARLVTSLASNKEQRKAAAMSFQRYWGHQREPVGTFVIFLPVVT